MSTLHKLLTLVAMVIVAMAFVPSTASAEVEAIDEATGEPCDPYCEDEGEGESTITSHVFGFETTLLACIVTFNYRTGPTGEGIVYNQKTFNCQFKPRGATNATSGDGFTWPAHWRYSPTFGWRLYYQERYEPIAGGAETTCTTERTIEDATDHGPQHWVATNLTCDETSPVRELEGEWNGDAGGFELVDL